LVDEADGKQAAVDGTKKLISQDKVEVMVGGISSEAQMTINGAATEAKIPYIGTGGRPDVMKDFSYTWYVSHLNSEPGVSLAEYVKKNVDGPVWAIGPDFVGGYSYVNPFVAAFTKAGGKMANPDGKATFVPYPTTTNFVPYLNQIVASGAKAVYCFFAGSMAVAFVKQYAQVIGKTIPLYVAGPTTEGNELLAGMGAAADGVYSSNDYAPDLDNPANRAFASAFQKEYNAATAQPNVLGWDAAQVLDLAIAAAGPNPTSESINAAVGKLGAIPSPRGDWRLGTNHAPIQQWYLRQVRTDGRGLANVVIQPLTTLGQ
jgi:branched-chain amino acid transport system substrate-binding protein